MLPVLHPRSQLPTHAVATSIPHAAGGAFWGKRVGKRLETEGMLCPSLGDAGGPGLKAFSGSGVRVSWLDEPLRRALSQPRTSTDVLWPPGRGCEARAGRTQRWLLLILSCPPPKPSPGLALGCAPPTPKWPTPSPRDSQLLPTTQHRGQELGLGRRICRPHHPVTGLRSVTSTATAFFLGLLGDPPTSLSTNDRWSRRKPAYGGPLRPFSAVKRSCSLGNGGGGGRGGKE